MTERIRIISFLKALDDELSKKIDLYIIGGGAITLAYNPENRTSDIDVVEADKEIEQKGGPSSKLSQVHGIYVQNLFELEISFSPGWRDRCQKQDLGLKKLSVFVADPYDIVLGKLARYEPKDIDDIRALVDDDHINSLTLLENLNNNLKEIKRNDAYRRNTILLFSMIFDHDIRYRKGKAEYK